MIVPLAIIKPDGLDATSLLGMNQTLPRLGAHAQGCSPSAWLLLTSSPAHCPNQGTNRDGPLTDPISQFLCSSNSLMTFAGSTSWSGKIFFLMRPISIGKQAYSFLLSCLLVTTELSGEKVGSLITGRKEVLAMTVVVWVKDGVLSDFGWEGSSSLRFAFANIQCYVAS